MCHVRLKEKAKQDSNKIDKIKVLKSSFHFQRGKVSCAVKKKIVVEASPLCPTRRVPAYTAARSSMCCGEICMMKFVDCQHHLVALVNARPLHPLNCF